MTASPSFDVIVIGAGHNGLAAAAALAAKGKSVCVLEKSARPGGMATGGIGSDPAAPGLAHLLYNASPRELRRLGFDGTAGLRRIDTVSLDPQGAHVVIGAQGVALTDGTAHPQSDAFLTLRARLVRFAGLLVPLAEAPPPGFEAGLTSLSGLRELSRLAGLGLGLKRLGKAEMREFLRILLSNVYDLLLDDLDDGPLAGAMAADAVRGAYAGPRSPGTVFSLMYRLGQGGTVAVPVGGMAAVAEAYAAKARAAGAEIVTGAEVARLRLAEDRITGVELADGRVFGARAVLSSAGPLQTMRMAGAEHFDIEALRRARKLRCKGTVAKMNLRLKRMPEFAGLSPRQTGQRLLIAPSVTYVERAFNPAKYGDLPTAPCIEMVMPGLTEAADSDTPLYLSAIVGHVPQEPAGGWTEAARSALTDTVIATIARYAPGLADLVQGMELFTPTDIEALTGAPGGHWHHGEMGLDQILSLRPTAGLSRYRLGPRGLYLCGASAHPGGDITGAPGRNSAAQLLADGVLA